MTPEDLDERNYTYCQCFLEGSPPQVHYFLVATPYRREARERAARYAEERWPGQVQEIVLYPRNYVASARRLFSQGRFEQSAQDSALSELL